MPLNCYPFLTVHASILAIANTRFNKASVTINDFYRYGNSLQKKQLNLMNKFKIIAVNYLNMRGDYRDQGQMKILTFTYHPLSAFQLYPAIPSDHTTLQFLA